MLQMKYCFWEMFSGILHLPFDNTVLQYYTCLWCINLLSKLIVISCLTQLMKIISDNSVVSDFSWKLSTGITNTRFYKSVDIIAVFVRGNVYMSWRSCELSGRCSKFIEPNSSLSGKVSGRCENNFITSWKYFRRTSTEMPRWCVFGAAIAN